MKSNQETEFKLKCGYSVLCRSERTRYGFRHLARLIDTNGNMVKGATVRYYNRTWESFTYETVIQRVLSGCAAFDEAAVKFIMQTLNDEARGQVSKQFGMIAGMAKVMSLMTDDQAGANKWKKRFMAAGLPGIEFPDDWDSLPEDEKQRRMDKALKAGCEPL